MKPHVLATLAVDALVVGLWVAVALAATETLRHDERRLEVQAVTAQALQMARSAPAALTVTTP